MRNPGEANVFNLPIELPVLKRASPGLQRCLQWMARPVIPITSGPYQVRFATGRTVGQLAARMARAHVSDNLLAGRLFLPPKDRELFPVMPPASPFRPSGRTAAPVPAACVAKR